MKSIMWNKKECYFCGTTMNLHVHHCLHGSANRRLADQYGLTVALCRKHHDMVHQSIIWDNALKKEAQKAWEERYGDRSAFIAVFGRSYLDIGNDTTETEKREIDPVERTREAQEEQG